MVPQLFEYDAARERLTRISIGHGATDNGDGNVETFHDAPQLSTQVFSDSDLPTAAQVGLAVSSDGSKVFFTSAASLTAQAIGGATNVYEYREGNVYLISDGHDASLAGRSPTVQLFGVDPSGANAFFLTADALVPQDSETQMVLYDAREQGGFPAPTLSAGCIGETCRGASGETPSLPLPPSAAQQAESNLTPPVQGGGRAGSTLRHSRGLAQAMRACRKKPKGKRRACMRHVLKRYAVQVNATQLDRRGK
jgi:hypothetical protein